MLESVSASHVIAHISDTHLLGGKRKLFKKVNVAQNLDRILDRLRAGDQQIDALVFTGDIADIAEPEAYRWIRHRVEPVAEELGAQLIWVIGNHDEMLREFAGMTFGGTFPKLAQVADKVSIFVTVLIVVIIAGFARRRRRARGRRRELVLSMAAGPEA